MREAAKELLKKFEQDNDISVGATDALTYWILHVRAPRGDKEEILHTHHGKKYISGPNEDGNVLILPNPAVSDAYLAESWGKMDTIDDFVKKGLERILSDWKAADQGQEEGCGTSCG
jgi:hypothetical protein